MCSDSTTDKASSAQSDFDGAVEAYQDALVAFYKGDPQPVINLFSCSDDVSLANPLGPPHRGAEEVDKAIAEAAAQISDGSIRGIEEISRYSTPDLGYVVQFERGQGRMAGSGTIRPTALRVTMIFRREGDTWRVVHRHADTILTSRPITTTIET